MGWVVYDALSDTNNRVLYVNEQELDNILYEEVKQYKIN